MIQRRNFFKQTHVREYQKQKYQNPYFKKTSRLRPWMFFVAGGTFLMGILALPFFLAYAPIFRITEIHIQGLTTIPEQEIHQVVESYFKQKRWGIFPYSSRWFFSKERLEKLLLSQEPLTSASIQRTGKTLSLEVKEEVTYVAWNSGDMYALLDLQGEVVEVLDPASANLLRAQQEKEALAIPEGGQTQPRALAPTIPLIVDKSASEITIGSTLLSQKQIEYLLSVDALVREMAILPKAYEIDTPVEVWMRIVADGPDILFDTGRDPQEEIGDLRAVLNAHAQERDEWEYIDIRFPENIFVK